MSVYLGDPGTLPPISYSMVGAWAVCEECGDVRGCQNSLDGLVDAELEHSLTCSGAMRLMTLDEMIAERKRRGFYMDGLRAMP